MSFMENLKQEANGYDTVHTENGALGYRTTMNPILDLMFKVSSLRVEEPDAIFGMFLGAYKYNPEEAFRWLFYVRDVRHGMGERRLFRIIMENMYGVNKKLAKHLLSQIAEYGRWDDLLDLLYHDSRAKVDIVPIIKTQLYDDYAKARRNSEESVSLLAKWMPSVSKRVNMRKKLDYMLKVLGMQEPHYRKVMAMLRDRLDVVELKMSRNAWHEINYSRVPGRANLIYNKAFLRHDESRRAQFLEDVANGKETLNASVLYPYEIVAKYSNRRAILREADKDLELMWANLKGIPVKGNTLVVSDMSGSMFMTNIGETNLLPAYVCASLTLYFAERAKGEFRNKAIIFSKNPRYIEFQENSSVHDRLCKLYEYWDASNTDIVKVFRLILDTAIKYSMKQEDMPENILILSDMEFDRGTDCNQVLFKQVIKSFEDSGYKLPRMVFWNISSRSGAIPLTTNDKGVALVSGFSANTFKMVSSGKLDPYECLKEQLYVPRYDIIADIVRAYK